MGSSVTNPAHTQRICWETCPDQYRHWTLSFDGPVASLSLDVAEDATLVPGYRLKLNSYDLGVDIELADAVQRIRFEHPEVHAVVVRSARERIFCAGANIMMLGQSNHAFKVNFCKFTNETRLAMEDASAHSGIAFLAAINGICAGGGYELALACDEIVLVDDGNSAVSLPETPLLGVLPGTGGLTRVIDKRKVRRDLADVFGTTAEGVKGKRALDWHLVDALVPRSRFAEAIGGRARELAARSDRPTTGPGISLTPLRPVVTENEVRHSAVRLAIDRERRVARITVTGPDGPLPEDPDAMLRAGEEFWPLRAFRELDDVLLRLRFDEPEIGTLLLETAGDIDAVLAVDRVLAAYQRHWLVREIVHFVKRTLKRLDLTARSIFAVIGEGSCFAGTLFELALAADRSYMLDDPDAPAAVALSPMNGGLLPCGNGLSRLQARYAAEPSRVAELLARGRPFDAGEALEAGLVTFAPDALDWDDQVRLAVEERASLSPDALTGMEANLRLVGPETMETKILGRLTAWQNWIFQRPNAVGERGALKVYGSENRAVFDWKRT
jgi:benzoyl-CoA-dihydrodiol lyase